MLSDKIRAHSEEKEAITKSLEEFVSRLPKKYSLGYPIDDWDISVDELTLRSYFPDGDGYYVTYPVDLVDASTEELAAFFERQEREYEERRERERAEAEQRIERSEREQLARLLTKYSWNYSLSAKDEE